MLRPPWQQRDPRRFKMELEAVAQRYPLLRLVDDNGYVIFEGTITVDGQSIYLHLTYPPDFPNQPPQIRHHRAFDGETAISHAETGHELIGGAACLYTKGYGHRSWKREFTGADAVSRFSEFMRATLAGSHIPEFHSEPESLPGTRGNRMVVISPGLAQLMTLPGHSGTFEGLVYPDRALTRIINIRDPKLDWPPIQEVGEVWAHLPSAKKTPGVWCHIDNPTGSWRELIPSPEAARQLVAQYAPWTNADDAASSQAILFVRAPHDEAEQEMILVELQPPSPESPQGMTAPTVAPPSIIIIWASSSETIFL